MLKLTEDLLLSEKTWNVTENQKNTYLEVNNSPTICKYFEDVTVQQKEKLQSCSV